MLLKVQIVNHGEEEAVSTGYTLEASAGEHLAEFDQVEIPENCRIEHIQPVGHHITENPDRKSIDWPLKRGIPRTCWVNFKM